MFVAQVLIGCDGVHSVVAQWLGMSEPASSGRSAVRGLSVYHDGHNLKQELRQFLAEGLRAGMVPISDTDIYWFLVNNTIPEGKSPPYCRYVCQLPRHTDTELDSNT